MSIDLDSLFLGDILYYSEHGQFGQEGVHEVRFVGRFDRYGAGVYDYVFERFNLDSNRLSRFSLTREYILAIDGGQFRLTRHINEVYIDWDWGETYIVVYLTGEYREYTNCQIPLPRHCSYVPGNQIKPVLKSQIDLQRSISSKGNRR